MYLLTTAFTPSDSQQKEEYAGLLPSSQLSFSSALPTPDKGYTDWPGKPAENPEGTTAGNAWLALAEPHGVDRHDRCC